MPYLEIGGSPGEENCAQVGKPDYERLGRSECRAYIKALVTVYGEPPEGARLRVHANSHDFGTYYDVRCSYPQDNPAAFEYACKVENGLGKWAQADMWPPVLYDNLGTPLLVIEDADLWNRTANPRCFPTKERRDAAQSAT